MARADSGNYSVLTVSLLRELFRNLKNFRALYEAEGTDIIRAPDGTEWSLWDIEYLHEQTVRLPDRQKQAIDLFLVENILEKQVALIMGVSITNPVGMYATSGLKKIVEMAKSGQLQRFKPKREAAMS